MTKAADAVQHFLDAWPLSGADPNDIHSVWVNKEDEPRTLRKSDIAAVLAELAQQRKALDKAAEVSITYLRNNSFCQHDSEGHNWEAIHAYLIKRWKRHAAGRG